MTTQKMHIKPVDVGSGVIATDFWLTDSAIVLIEAKAKGNPVKSRLDLQKRMFIDPIPGARDYDGVLSLVRAVVAARERRAA